MKSAKLSREVGNWVRGATFWDREDELEGFLEHLDEGAHILLTAPRRTGKTSLLREAERVLVERGRDYTLFVDLERALSPEDAIVELSVQTRPHQGLWTRTREVFHNVAENIDELKIDDLSIRLRDGVAGNWRGKGDRLLETLARLDRPVVLFLDEFPILINRLLKNADYDITPGGRQQTDAFLSWLRDACSRYQGHLRFILSGSIGLAPVLRQAGLSATINHLRPFELDPWEPAVARECLHALARHYNLGFEDGAPERMTELLGVCVPHHVQMFFSHLYDDCRKRWARQPAARNLLTCADVERVYQRRLLSAHGHAELSHYEERLRMVLGPRVLPLAIDLLNEATHTPLSHAAAAIIAEDHLADAADRPTVLREILGILEHDGYLAREDGVYGFTSHLLRDWWRARFGSQFTPTAQRGARDGTPTAQA